MNCFVLCLLFLFFLNCDNTPISSGAKADELKIVFYNVRNITTTTTTVIWSCSAESQGYLVYDAGHGAENTLLLYSRNGYNREFVARDLFTESVGNDICNGCRY